MTNSIKISVRSLVEYVYRSGSIESGFKTATSLTEGTRIHQQVQKEYKENDQKEVYVSMDITYNDILYCIDGRCDGLLKEESTKVIDEIKSTSLELSSITCDSYPVHWAQAKFYAYMYLKEHEEDQITVQLTYVQKKTNEQKKFRETVTLATLETYVANILTSYGPYARLMLQHKNTRNKSIQDLSFPFPKFREGQRNFAKAVYKTIKDNKNLFANAPTGTGKTISTLFPAVKAIGEGELEQIYYLTAKTTTRQTAEETFSLLQENNLTMNTVTLTAKDKICFKEETICNKEYCEFADGHYDRINGAILDLFENETIMNRPVIEEYARKHKVCPFEFSLDAAYAADAIICDYNYVFDPRVSLKRTGNDSKKNTALLIDEAHNLVDRSRSMFSADVYKSAFLSIMREYKNKNSDIYQAAKDVNEQFLVLKKQMGELKENQGREAPTKLVEYLERFNSSAEMELAQAQESLEDSVLLDTYFTSLSFIRIASLYNSAYITYIKRYKSEVVLKLFCVNPSTLLQKTGKGYRSKIYFSATFTPLDYFQDMLGWNENDYKLKIASPFPKENYNVYIKPLSTRYKDRDHSIAPIANTIAELVSNQPGNHLVFFPSYVYMNEVYDYFIHTFESIPTLIQDTNMSEEARDDFLQHFKSNPSTSLVGFAVLGGVFSEGVDLKGDRLIGVTVVGTGLPQINYEQNIVKDYFQQEQKNGFDYAYVFPGINKVLQAAGRLIRTETDQGSIVLIDDRYLQSKYQSLFPVEWGESKIIR